MLKKNRSDYITNDSGYVAKNLPHVQKNWDFGRDEKGDLIAVETGEIDFAKLADADRSQTGFYNIQNQIAHGDARVLARMSQEGYYGDIAGLQRLNAEQGPGAIKQFSEDLPGDIEHLKKELDEATKKYHEALQGKQETEPAKEAEQ